VEQIFKTHDVVNVLVPEIVMSAKPFASQADLQEKKTSFIKLSDNAYAYTA
jgi:hypothetical protein